MPLTGKDAKLLRHFESEYGEKEGERTFYATLNKHINQGRPIRTPESRRLIKKRRKSQRKV